MKVWRQWQRFLLPPQAWRIATLFIQIKFWVFLSTALVGTQVWAWTMVSSRRTWCKVGISLRAWQQISVFLRITSQSTTLMSKFYNQIKLSTFLQEVRPSRFSVLTMYAVNSTVFCVCLFCFFLINKILISPGVLNNFLATLKERLCDSLGRGLQTTNLVHKIWSVPARNCLAFGSWSNAMTNFWLGS